MKVGYACTPLTIEYKTTRSLTIKNFNEEFLITLIEENLNDLLEILKYNKSNGIKLFRISSDIIPLGSHPINTFEWWVYFKDTLLNIGNYIKENDLRVSMHPGQYTVLNSPKKDVLNKAVKDLNYHCIFLNSLNLDFTHKIILHVGGVYNNKEDALCRFIKNFNLLSTSCKKRLVIENDERCFSLDDVLHISSLTNIPVVFDNLHYNCYKSKTSYSLEKILNSVSKTWRIQDGAMKVHYSQQAFDKKVGSHSPTINIEEFINYYNVAKNFNLDIMLEVKDKNISSLKCLNIIDEISNKKFCSKNFLLEKEKYSLVLESFNKDYFLKNEETILKNMNFRTLYKITDFIVNSNPLINDYTSTSKDVWTSISNIVNKKENAHFTNLIKEKNLIKIRNYIYKTTRKYSKLINTKLYNSYYYYY